MKRYVELYILTVFYFHEQCSIWWSVQRSNDVISSSPWGQIRYTCYSSVKTAILATQKSYNSCISIIGFGSDKHWVPGRRKGFWKSRSAKCQRLNLNIDRHSMCMFVCTWVISVWSTCKSKTSILCYLKNVFPIRSLKFINLCNKN